MTTTLEAIRAAGGIVHSDGNIFFRDISMLQGLAGAAPAAVVPRGEYPQLPAAAWEARRVRIVLQENAYTAAQMHAYFDLGRQPATAAPALEAPAAPSGDEEAAFTKWFQCQQGTPYQGMWEFARAAWMARAAAPALEAPAAPAVPAGFALVPIEPTQQMLDAGRWSGAGSVSSQEVWDRMLATVTPPPAAYADDLVALVTELVQALRQAAPDNDLAGHALDYLKRNGLQGSPLLAAPAAPSALATQVIENLLQLARIVNTAVEDWGESFPDGSCEVKFHKDEADKMEAILEFFDGLPDAPEEEGVILSGPSRAARVLRAQAAPAAPEDPMDWPLPCDVTVGHGTIRKGCKLRTLVLRMQVLYNLAQETELAAPAAPAVDASPLLAPETELDAVVRDAEQIIRDAEHYRFIKRHRLILSGGTDTFGWPIAPFGDECDRYIAQELATERAAQAKEGGGA